MTSSSENGIGPLHDGVPDLELRACLADSVFVTLNAGPSSRVQTEKHSCPTPARDRRAHFLETLDDATARDFIYARNNKETNRAQARD